MPRHSQFVDDPLPHWTPKLPRNFKSVIADLLLAWAEFDSELLQLMLETFSLRTDEGRILIGTMDMRTRIQRLKTLFTHLGITEGATLMGKMADDTEYWVHPRNVVCHVDCLGSFESDPNIVVFGPYKTVVGQRTVTTHTVPIAFMKDSAKYAKMQAGIVRELTATLRAAPPQSPDEGHPPTPPQ